MTTAAKPGPHPLGTRKTDAILLTAKLVGGGAGLALTVGDPVPSNSDVVSVTFVSTGKHTIVFRYSYPQLLSVLATAVVGTTAGLMGRFSAFDIVAGTATIDLTVAGAATDAALTDTIYINWIARNSGKNQ